MDVHEDKAKNQITSTFELPGLKKDDVDITLDDHNRLTVSGKSSMSNTQDIEGYTVRERMFGSFSRSLQLPEGIKVRRVNFVVFKVEAHQAPTAQPNQSQHEQWRAHRGFSQEPR